VPVWRRYSSCGLWFLPDRRCPLLGEPAGRPTWPSTCLIDQLRRPCRLREQQRPEPRPSDSVAGQAERRWLAGRQAETSAICQGSLVRLGLTAAITAVTKFAGWDGTTNSHGAIGMCILQPAFLDHVVLVLDVLHDVLKAVEVPAILKVGV
jgi:hypothetical protein